MNISFIALNFAFVAFTAHAFNELPEGFQILERTTEKSHSKGAAARESLKTAVENSQWDQVAEHYKTAFWHLQMTEIKDVQYTIEGNGMNLQQLAKYDISKMNFAWLRTFGKLKLSYHTKRENLVKRLLKKEKLTAEDIRLDLQATDLQGKTLINIQNHCEQMEEVAGVYAEALKWEHAKKTAIDACGELTASREGMLLGYLSIGIKRGGKISNKKRNVICQIVNSMSKTASVKRKDPDWATAVLSLEMSLKRRFNDQQLPKYTPETMAKTVKRFQATIPVPTKHPRDKNVKSKTMQPKYKHQIPKNLSQMTAAKMDDILEQADRVDYRYLLPIIEEAFKQKKRFNASEAWHFYTYSLTKYYYKDGDMWESLRWWREAYWMSNGDADHNWMHRLFDKIDNDALLRLRIAFIKKIPAPVLNHDANASDKEKLKKELVIYKKALEQQVEDQNCIEEYFSSMGKGLCPSPKKKIG